jgi:hypothetical protein
MTIDDATPERLRLIHETVADLTAELQHLRATDRRRLKLATMITVLEDRIASCAEAAVEAVGKLSLST